MNRKSPLLLPFTIQDISKTFVKTNSETFFSSKIKKMILFKCRHFGDTFQNTKETKFKIVFFPPRVKNGFKIEFKRDPLLPFSKLIFLSHDGKKNSQTFFQF